MTVFKLFFLSTRSRLLLLVFLALASNDPTAYGQDSGGEHSQHHPGQTGAGEKEKGGGMMGGGMGGGMGGKGGGMGGMMQKMGAPKPKDLYPKLMDLPDLPLEERTQIKQEAHQRMIDGTGLLSKGIGELSSAVERENFAAMQTATAKMREGLARFESGLAAHRALAEGKAPRNVAITWFKRELNLLPLATTKTGFQLFGMSLFHTSIMALLILFATVMVWMYFFKMRRAAALMEKLAMPDPATIAPPTMPASRLSRTMSAASPVTESTEKSAADTVDDCCQESSVECEAEENATGSTGLLRIGKRTLCRLRVARIYQETPDVKTFRLVACHGGGIPFSYLPGQFLTITMPVEKAIKPIRRSYTISSSPTQGYYCEVTVKREDQGAGSRYLHDSVKEGDTLEVQALSGKFFFTGEEADSVVLVAGGVGITPMMSITRALTDMEWRGEIYFLVACRDPEHFIFATELERLQERHPNLHVFAAMSRIEKEIKGIHRGRLSKELLADWVPDIRSKWIHICGAPPMMESTKEMLAELGVPAERIHTENFGSQQKPRAKATAREKAGNVAIAETTATVTFSTSGKSTHFLPDETVLDASERVGVEIDSSCRTGMCGVCAVKLLSGQVTMEVEDGLEPDDKAAGMVLACQAESTADLTVEA